MKISVIVPAFNEEQYIEKCLECLMNQREKADEIIVVDNNSTDKTVEIAKLYPVRIVHEKQQGMIPARNRGFNEATNPIMARIDADTQVLPDWIKTIKSDFKDESILAVTGPVYFYDQPLTKFFSVLHKYVVLRTTHLILGHTILFGSNMAIRKSAWNMIKEELCTDDNKVHEDVDLAMHLNKVGKLKFDNNLIVGISARRIVDHPDSLIEYPVRFIKSLLHHEKNH